MKNKRIILALIMTAVFILTAVSCKSGGNKKDSKPEDSESKIITSDTDKENTSSEIKPTFELPHIESDKPYYIAVNKKANCVTVYKKDADGEFKKPVKAMICSTGPDTPLGTFKTINKYRWRPLIHEVWGQYATRIVGSILFHSVPYTAQNPATLQAEEYNKLGTSASAGCVRLTVEDSKWIMDNCPLETTVTIYEDEYPGPLGKPKAPKIANDEKWDPTDPLYNKTDSKPQSKPSGTASKVVPTESKAEPTESKPQQIQSDKPYFIKVNKKANCVTVYAKDGNGEFTKPIKAMICSTGPVTPVGTYKTINKYRWRPLIHEVWGQYATRIVGSILFHSVPYTAQDPATLQAEEYNKLGTSASAGCVRLTVEDSKWIMDNCPLGTTVTIYEDENPGPLGRPQAQKIANDEKWDPTDPLRPQ